MEICILILLWNVLFQFFTKYFLTVIWLSHDFFFHLVTFLQCTVCRNDRGVSFSFSNNVYSQQWHEEKKNQKDAKGSGWLIFRWTQMHNSKEQNQIETWCKITTAVSKAQYVREGKRNEKAQSRRYLSHFLWDLRESLRKTQQKLKAQKQGSIERLLIEDKLS